MRKQAVAPAIDIEAAVEELGELAQRKEQLRNELHRLDQQEPELQAKIKKAEKAQRIADNQSVFGLREVPPEIAAELEAAQKAVADLEAKREETQTELEEITAKRVAIIGEVMQPAWAEYVEALQARYSEGDKLADEVEKLIPAFVAACERESRAESDLNRILAPLGHGGQLLRDDLQHELPKPSLPDTPEQRQALRRSIQLKKLYAQDLTHRW